MGMADLKYKFNLFRDPKWKVLATEIWVATHYLRTSDLRDYLTFKDLI